MLAIATATLGLLLLTRLFIKGRVYRNWFTDALEALFLLNLGVFSVATNHIKLAGGNQLILANTSVGIAFAMFIVTIFCHAHKRLQGTCNGLWKVVLMKLQSSKFTIGRKISCRENQLHAKLLSSGIGLGQSTAVPTKSVISVPSNDSGEAEHIVTVLITEADS